MTTSIDHLSTRTRDGDVTTAATRRVTLPLGPSLERRRLQSYLTLMLCDGLGIAVAFFSVWRTMFGNVDGTILVDLVTLFIPIYWLMALKFRVYSTRALISVRYAQLQVGYSLFATIGALILMSFVAHSTLEVGRLLVGFDVLAAAVVLASIRSVARPLVLHRCGPTVENVLIIDDGGVPVRVAGAWTVQTREHGLRPDYSDPHMLDRLGMFMTNMDRVLVTCQPERRAAWAMIFKGSNICGEVVDHDVQALGVIGARRLETLAL